MHKHDRSRPEESGAARGKTVVLVVDDDAEVRWATVRILEEAGFQVLAGGTAAEAVELTHRHRPALVLLDVVLPDGSGVDVARELKRDPALAGVFVSLVSGARTNPREQADGLTRGLADGYIARPFSKVEFLARVDAFLRIRVVQEALRESEEVLRGVFASALDAIVMIDGEGRAILWNPAAEKMFGYTAAEMLGQPIHELLVSTGLRQLFQANFPAFRKTGQGAAIGKVVELAALRKDGSEFPMELALAALHKGGQWRAVGIIRDITDRKQAEERINRYLSDLEAARDAQERNAAELARMVEALGLEKERAEAATLAKSEFLANMSHEIRTPMNGVIGMTGLLLDTDLSDEQRRYAGIVRASGESLLGIINDILDFSKIEAKKLDLETLDFDLSSLLEDFAATLAARAHEKGLELLCAADPGVPTLLRGDPGRLRQILTNLAGNAVKFTKEGEVAVRVSLEEETETECRLRFSVRDTGIGIPQDKIGMLFDKFSQVDTSTTRTHGGTGLGLAISKQLAELMGGSVGVESEGGQGSQFWFTVRLGKQPEGARTQSPPAGLCGVRVLIVDDNATSREILTTRMTAWGMRPLETGDGPAALAALGRAVEENDPFRVAVIDMQMPGMDGKTLGRAIRADGRLASTRMVMLTSMGARGDARRFQEIGFAAYATKPIRHQELMGILSLTLAERDGTQTAPQPIATRHAVRETLNPFAGQKARILVAEDNIVNQHVALGILKKLGLSADAVANGAEALKALETIPYDLVLMDVQMPVMDGLEAAREIRNLKSNVLNRAIPIIAMTAHAMQGDRERCLEAGMNDYVPKPVSPQALTEVLARWLPKKNDEAPAQAVTGGFPGDIPRQLEALRALARQVQKAGQAGDPGSVAAGMDALEREFARLREAMANQR